jgi:hypothetical protein
LFRNDALRSALPASSWLQPQFFPPLKIALPDNGEICAGVFARRKLAQFATSLLANHKFWLVPPLREKAASAVQPDIERKRNVVKD